MDQQHIFNKTRVINDPFSQPTVPDGSDFRLILKFWGKGTHGPAMTVVDLVDQ